MSNNFYAAGIDIGFSNVKVAHGPSPSALEFLCLPSGAGPLDTLPKTANNDYDLRGGERVVLGTNGSAWGSLVPHRMLQHHERVLHKDYPFSDEYLALYLGALRRIGQPVIHQLVVGLPVEQFYEDGTGTSRTRLSERLQGSWFTGDSVHAKVEKVTVIPQPLGGYFAAMAAGAKDFDPTKFQRVCVIDPGFYSVDAVLIDSGAVLNKSSGSVFKATSVLLESVANTLTSQGHRVSVERLEEALRAGKTDVQIGSTLVDLDGHLAAASIECGNALKAALGRSMRLDHDGVDAVVLVGGGARFFEKTVREVFPKSFIYLPKDPVIANAHGFGAYAARDAARMRAA